MKYQKIKWKTNQSTKINLIGCSDTIVNSPSFLLFLKTILYIQKYIIISKHIIKGLPKLICNFLDLELLSIYFILNDINPLILSIFRSFSSYQKLLLNSKYFVLQLLNLNCFFMKTFLVALCYL